MLVYNKITMYTRTQISKLLHV